jgi:uncharacterized protein YacL
MRLSAKKKRPKWSIKTSFWAGIIIALLVCVVASLILKKSIWIELEVISIILSVFIFIYLTYVLYHGIRFSNHEKYEITLKKIDFADLSGASPIVDTGGNLTSAGAEAGIIGIVVGFILDLLISIVFSFLIALIFWIGLNFILTAGIVLFMPLFYIFRRSIRYVVAKGRRCYHDITKSLLHSFRATIIATSWLYIIIFVGHYISIKIYGNGSG